MSSDLTGDGQGRHRRVRRRRRLDRARQRRRHASSHRSSSWTGFGYDQGWRVDQHPRYVADLTGDGKADIVGLRRRRASGSRSATVTARFQAPQSRARGLRPEQGLAGRQAPADDRPISTATGAPTLSASATPACTPRSATAAAVSATPQFVLADLGYDQGWRVESHPRLTADVTGDGRDDIVGFGDDGVWVAVSGGNGVNLVLTDFGYNQGWRVASHPRAAGRSERRRQGRHHRLRRRRRLDRPEQRRRHVPAGGLRARRLRLHAGPVVAMITIDFHTLDDDLNDDTAAARLRQEPQPVTPPAAVVPPRSRPTSESFRDHDADWFGKNPYLGCAVNANNGDLRRPVDAHRHAAAALQADSASRSSSCPRSTSTSSPTSSDTWKFDYTLTITLDDGTVLPPYNSNVDGLVGIVLNQDNRNYYGICTRVRRRRRSDQARHERVADRGDDRVQDARRRQERRHDADIHIVNRISATESQDIWSRPTSPTAREVPGRRRRRQTSPTGGSICRWRRSSIYLRDMVLPVVYINIAADEDQWIFDYRVTLFFGGQPYSWTVSGVVLDQDHHKHMGVYSGRAFPTVVLPDGADRAGRAGTSTHQGRLAGVRRPEDWTSCSTAGRSSEHRIRLVKVQALQLTGLRRPEPTVVLGHAGHHERSRRRRTANRSSPGLRDGDDVLALHLRSWAGSRRSSASATTSTTSTPSRSPSRSTPTTTRRRSPSR